jgi:hypothetical protein|tara:strand:+ start:55 stop:270 length:216 start_codon:yes stop_codon:yes gene_type:complete
MIIFKGDYIQLKYNFYGDNNEWFRVADIEVYDILVLSNGARVCASKDYLSDVKSHDEYNKLNMTTTIRSIK